MTIPLDQWQRWLKAIERADKTFSFQQEVTTEILEEIRGVLQEMAEYPEAWAQRTNLAALHRMMGKVYESQRFPRKREKILPSTSTTSIYRPRG
jgi:hypothetical protein